MPMVSRSLTGYTLLLAILSQLDLTGSVLLVVVRF
jgi:hypothetical protein